MDHLNFPSFIFVLTLLMVLVKIIFGLEVNVDSISLVPDSFDGVF